MSEATETSVNIALDDMDVIDADSHIDESLDQILPYMDENYSGIRELISDASPITSIFRLSIAGPAPEGGPYGKGVDFYEDEYHIEDKLNEMSNFGIDYSIISGSLHLSLPTVSNNKVAISLAQAYNSWIVDEFVDGPDSVKSLILAAHQRPDLAAEEIDQYANESDIVGVLLPGTGLLPPPGYEIYNPIYEAAQDNDLPICIHSGGAQTAHHFPTLSTWEETYAEGHTLVHPFSQMWNLASLVYQGVPERFPDLDFVLQEAGISWLPYMKWRMDDHYLERSHELPEVTKLPSEYIDNQFYVTSQPVGHTQKPTQMSQMIKLAGVDNILYSADLPHFDFDPPEELYSKLSPTLDSKEVSNIMGGNSKKVFSI